MDTETKKALKTVIGRFKTERDFADGRADVDVAQREYWIGTRQALKDAVDQLEKMMKRLDLPASDNLP